MANYAKTSVADGPRAVLHDEIGLTGAEVSINVLPAGASIPFVHSHKQNEEIYGILEGSGKAEIDGDTADDEAIKYVCIQVKEGSLEQHTADDAVV